MTLDELAELIADASDSEKVALQEHIDNHGITAVSVHAPGADGCEGGCVPKGALCIC